MSTTREESLLNAIAEGGASGVKPYTREEKFLAYIAGETTEKPIAYTRKEKLLDKIAKNGAGGGGGGGAAKEEQEKTVTITENGTTEVTPDEGKTLSKVTVETSVLAGGEPGKPYVDTSKITDFYYFCCKNRFNDVLDKIDTSKGTNFEGMFNDCSLLETIPQLDTSNGTSFSSMFNDCSLLETIPQLDTSNGTSFSSMFKYCRKLKAVPRLDISKGTTFTNMFIYCNAVETIALTVPKGNFSSNSFQGCTALTDLTIGEGWAVSIYLTYSNNLTQESLHGMIENLADLTGSTAKTFQIGATNLAKIDEEHIAMLEAKNWTYS